MSVAAIRLFLQKGEDDQLRRGFPWVFENEVAFVKTTAVDGSVLQTPLAECTANDGEFAEVYTKGGQYLGCGILNKKSKIPLRILSRSRMSEGKLSFTVDFFTTRITDALAARSLYFKKTDSYRLLFAEADLLPGLVAERYCCVTGEVILVVQFLTLGVEVFRSQIIEALQTVCKPNGIYERSDVHVRALEGLEERKGWIGTPGQTELCISENNILLGVNIENGQKTGYFLDQKYNRQLAARFARGRRVLDTFSHTGAFALNAAAAGASEVTAVDISELAVENIRKNAVLNKVENVVRVKCADTFDILKEYERDGVTFDLIILDPPAFTKSAKMIDRAYGGYKEINLRAMKLLSPGGLLLTCSCSYFFDAPVFYDMLAHAAQDAGRTVQVLEKRGPAPDHPVLLGYQRSDYFKCALLRVL